MSALRSAPTTATLTTRPNEQSEAKFPIVVERCALIRIPVARAATAAGLASRPWCARARISWSTPKPTVPTASRGVSTVALDATGNQIQLRANGAWKTDQPNAKLLVARN